MKFYTLLCSTLLFCGDIVSAPIKNKVAIYPAPAREALNQTYTVAVNGKNVPVYNAKIAANDKPDQFKSISDIKNSYKYFDVAGFGYFDLQGTAMVTVTVPNEVASVKILPAAAGIKAIIHGHSVSFPVSLPKNLTIEINGDWVRSCPAIVSCIIF